MLQVDFVDIAMDACAPHHYKEAEDLATFKSTKTSRGPLQEGWRDDTHPIMCSYKLVDVRFDMMYLMQARIEEFVHKVRLLVCYKFSYLKCRAFERSCWLDIGKRSPGSMSGLG